MARIVIGIDPHSQVHSAAAVDEHGRPLALLQVAAGPEGLDELVGWVQDQDGERLVAVEGCKGYGLALARRLLAAGELVVDVASHLTAESRRRSRRRGKDDEGDAVAIAWVALREPDLPRMDDSHLDADLKLLVDARDQLVQEEARVRNRLHALLLVMAPGYQTITGPLISRPAFARARSLALKSRKTDPMRAKLALAAIRRLNAIRNDVAGLEVDIDAELARRQPAHLLAIPGVGPLVAAKILGEVRDIRHYASPASRLTPARHPSRRPAATLNVTGSPAEATASSTAHSSRSPWSKHAGTPTHGPTSHANGAKARPPQKLDAASNATSPTSSSAR
jgi:transposase